MLYLLLAILTSALNTVVMRLSEKHISGKMPLLAVSYTVSLVLAGGCMLLGGQPVTGEGMGTALWMGGVNGIFYVLGFVMLQLNVSRNGVVLSATFMKLGLLVPLLMSVLFFGEIPGGLQIMGILMAIAAIVLIHYEKEETVMRFRIGLPLLLLAGGCSDIMSKIFEETGPLQFSDLFLLCTFVMAVILCTGMMLLRHERPHAKDVLFGALIGIPNYFSARVILKAIEHLPAVVVFPTYNAGAIVAVSLAGVLLFHEKLGRRQWIAVGIILAAIVLLNI